MDQSQSNGEKITLLSQNIALSEPSRSHRKRRHFHISLLAALFLLSWWSFNGLPNLRIVLGQDARADDVRQESQDIDFADVVPSEKLEWVNCFGTLGLGHFKCARLTVPMDYHRPLNESKDNPRVHIALLLVEGKRTGSKKYSKSPLILNPGGPGGSGVIFALGAGKAIQSIVDPELDVIGFDPRGIGATTPRTDCFSFPESLLASTEDEDQARGLLHRAFWESAGREIGLVNSSTVALQKLDTRARAVAKLCQEKDSLNGKDSIFKYVNTPNVARDMISIVDAWDEWTKSLDKEVDSLSEPCQGEEKRASEPMDLETPYSQDTKGKLVYWGFSYGTLLGATFASMFPERVGRIVLDGVVDADLYVSPIWAESLIDADAIYNSFPKYCAEAKDKCALYRSGDSPEDIAIRFNSILTKLQEHPITAIDPRTKSPVIGYYSDIKLLIFGVLYAPQAFPALAKVVDLLYRGQNDELALLTPLYDLNPFCAPSLPYWTYPTDAGKAIMCSDKRYPLNETLPNLEVMFQKMANGSSFADVWMTLMLGCEAWGIEANDPPMRWDDHPAHKQKPIKTSFPVLFISNTNDPVTPLYAGVKMAGKFVDAGLLEQKSMGHCSLAAASRCTSAKIKAYFTKGEVPSPPKKGPDGRELVDGEWEKCEADEWPFHPYDEGEWISARGKETAAEVETLNAVKEIQNAFRQLRFWGQKGGMDLGMSQNL